MTKPSPLTEEALRLFQAGLRLQEQGEIAESEKAFRKAIEVQPDFASAWWGLGTNLTRQHKFEENIKVFRKATQLAPDNAIFLDRLGFLLMLKGDVVEGKQILTKVLQLNSKQFNSSGRGFLQMTKMESKDSRSWYGLGFVLGLRGDKEGSARAMLKACNLGLHVALVEDGEFRSAEMVSREFTELDADNSGAWCMLGAALMMQKKYQEAEVAYKKAIEIEQEYTHAWLGLATTLLHLDRPEEAEEAKRISDLYVWNVE